MQKLPLFEHDWNDTSIMGTAPVVTPAQFEITQALASGDFARAEQLIDLQHDTDTDLQ